MIALGPSRLDRHSHGLWSLWEMLSLNAGPFAEALTSIAALKVLIEQTTVNAPLLPKDTYEGLRGTILFMSSNLRTQCEALELSTSLLAIDNLISFLGKKPENFLRTSNDLLLYIVRLVPDELKSRTMLALTVAEAELFTAKVPAFGRDVANRFPAVSYDIEESGKCLALGRSTASAFHSIRSLEAGIRALSRCLGIPDPTRAKDRSWGELLKSLKAGIDVRWPGSSTRMSGDGQFFDNAHASLAAMQNPWRNATMHLDQIYTEEGARDLFNVVGAFMRHLSSRLDENGDPKV